MKLNTNFIYIAGYAGHGKDTVKQMIMDKYTHDYNDITMAETLKENACTLILPEHIDITGKQSKLQALNDLKDNYSDKIYFANLTTRVFLQKLGTEFYRSLDENIHTKFVANKLLKTLENSNKGDVLFMATDIRFPNELNFMLKTSQLKNDDLKDYLRFYLKSEIHKIPENGQIVKRFENVFNVDRNDSQTKKILESVLTSVNDMKKTNDYKKEWDLNIPEPNGMKKEEAIKYGYIHIFRPILDMNKEYSNELKGPNLIKEIKEYTGLDTQKILDVAKYYNASKLEFNAENVIKYGFLRADVTHPSETAINEMKPEPIISTPLKNGDFKENIYKLLKVIEIDCEPTADLKKKNYIKRNL